MNETTPSAVTTLPSLRQAPWLQWRGSGRVLVVEDDPAVRMLVVRALPKLGFTASSAGNGAEALSLFQANPLDYVLILTDLKLPGMEVGDMIRAIQAVRPELAVILMTGYPREKVAEKVGKAHLAGFVPKPFTLETLAAEIRSVLAP